MLALQGTFVSWETLDSLVLTRYVIDLLVYQTHIALKELRGELFDWEIIDFSTSSWELIGQNILWYMAAWLGWLQSGMCFWGPASVPRNSGTENRSSQSDIQPLRTALESMVFKHREKHVDSICLFICLIGKEPVDITCCIETCRICIEWWEHIYIILWNSQNDWFPWGNCMIFMPSLKCNLKSVAFL